jgi:hypothetical protein
MLPLLAAGSAQPSVTGGCHTLIIDPTPMSWEWREQKRFAPSAARALRNIAACGKKAIAIAAEGAHAAFGQRWRRRFRGRQARMTTRSRREVVTFKHPFRIRGIDRQLPAGDYEVVTDEESIEGLSFEAFRRVATTIMVPAESAAGLAMEMVAIGSVDLADAQRVDASASDA